MTLAPVSHPLLPGIELPVPDSNRLEMGGDDFAYLRRGRESASPSNARPVVRIADLFCGAGGMTQGFWEAAQSLGLRAESVLACDNNPTALSCFEENFGEQGSFNGDIRTLFDGEFGGRKTQGERELQAQVGTIDLLVGGPPCQGHSDLNNRTRHADPKNNLYFLMARAAELLEPESVVIENVPGAVHDRGRAVQRTSEALQSLGYKIHSGVLNLLELGVPQRRKRYLLIATRKRHLGSLQEEVAPFLRPIRPISWAIADLEMCADKSNAPFDAIAKSKDTTRKRIEYLYAHDLYELPNSERPPCHQGDHSYKSIYGRLRWDEPAQTITRGFYSMCMGRYVHPSRPRTLTAHEAARLQFFPDSFSFDSVTKRSDLATIIGNAVPPKLAFVLGQILLGLNSGGV